MYSTDVLLWIPYFSAVALGQPAGMHARDESRTIITDPETGRSFVPGETSTDRTIYNTVNLFCAVVLSVLLGMYHLASLSSLTTSSTSKDKDTDSIQGKD